MSHDNKHALSLGYELLLSGTAGVVCRFPTHPLDTCKTVAFSSDAGSSSLFSAAKKIFSREGVTGFYRGVGITALAAFPGNALYFVSYEWFRESFSCWHLPISLVHLGGGFFAEAVSCVIWVPVDVVKERLQAQAPTVEGRYKNSYHGIKTCFKNEHLRGLYKGYLSTLASYGPFSAVYFCCYEYFIRVLMPLQLSVFTHSLSAAFLGNTVAAVVTSPLELVKTRLQIQSPILEHTKGNFALSNLYGYRYSSFLSGFREIVKEHGALWLWRGSITRAIHTAPNAALTMGVYKWLKERYPLS